MARARWLSSYLRIIAVMVVWGVALFGLVAWGLWDRAHSAGTQECAPSTAGQVARVPARPATLEPRSEPRTGIPFGHDRAVRRRQVEYDVTDPGKVLAQGAVLDVFVGQFVRNDGAQQLRGRSITADARVHGGEVLLDICFDRTDAGFGRPGTYSGTISIVDPRVARTDIAFSVTLAFPYWQLVLAVFLAMLLPATLYVWFLRGSFISHDGLQLRDMQVWLFSRTALMSLGTGFAAAFGLFSATYVQSLDWGGDATAATALFGGTFAAFVAAATAVTAAGSDKRSAFVADGVEGGSARRDESSPSGDDQGQAERKEDTPATE